MRFFIKIFFALTFTFSLFSESTTEASDPTLTEKGSTQSIDNSKAEPFDVSNIAPITTDIPADSDKAQASEDDWKKELPREAIRDIRPAVELPMETWQIIAISLLLIALLIALIYAIKKHFKHHSGTSVIPIDPYHKALQELEAALQLIQRLDQRPFATGITDAVREYLAAVFSLPAPECTTEEVLEQLPNVTLLTEEIQQNIIHLLQQCDLAKFTKMQFDQPERLKLYNQAKEFIQAADKLIQLQNANSQQQ